MNTLVKNSFLNALGTLVYVFLVTQVMQNAEKIFGPMNNTFGPIAFLMLFVLSAAITGSLVIGKPALMYLNGQKVEAIRLFLYTVGWLALFTVIMIVVSASM